MVLLYRISYLDICMVLLCDVPAPSVRPPERERERERARRFYSLGDQVGFWGWLLALLYVSLHILFCKRVTK